MRYVSIKVTERNSQVLLMPKIYQGAERVLVWLGGLPEGQPNGLEFVKTIVAARKRLSKEGGR